MSKSKLMDVIHGTASDLHKSGVMDTQTMHKFDSMCLPKIKVFSAVQIVRLRRKNKVSQAVFAAYMNTTPSTIQNWEQGQKKPSRLALKLLNLIDRHGIDFLAA